MTPETLKWIYHQALARCAPDVLVCAAAERAGLGQDHDRSVVAIGKCAGPMLDGLAAVMTPSSALVVIPEGYPEPRWPARVMRGGHPYVSEASFAAGRALLEYVDAHAQEDILFLISGGGSACVEWPLAPWFTEADIMQANARLVAAGLPIRDINVVRKHLSAIKGGRLAARVRGVVTTMVLSDVAPGRLADVASGPTLADPSTREEAAAILARIGSEELAMRLRNEDVPDTVKRLSGADVTLIADNATLIAAAAAVAAEAGIETVSLTEPLDDDVEAIGQLLARAARELKAGQLLVAGGEPTVVKRGAGRGGRCSELALRFARAAGDVPVTTLFAGSDGVDGNSGTAGIMLKLPRTLDRQEIERALDVSDSATLAVRLGEAVIIHPTGNNLRDLILLARG